MYGEGSFINIDYIIHDYKDILNFSQYKRIKRVVGIMLCVDSANDPYEDQINATSWLDMGGYICSVEL